MIDEDSIGVIILLVVEGTSLDIGILGIGGWDSDIVDVEEEDVIDDLTAWEYVCDKGGAINFQASKHSRFDDELFSPGRKKVFPLLPVQGCTGNSGKLNTEFG
ncbi:hypothetical protein TNCV_549881 [Trichonephila clavipes]|nr:hypothetical protein TNCV_549881 [Trichonephila clavipes]